MNEGLHNLKPAEGSTHRSKRIGRGIGSGHGKTSGRGHKGDKSRGQTRQGFEGGQTPLHQRLPLYRGTRHRNPSQFKSVTKKVYALVNLNKLEEAFESGAEISPEILLASGFVRDLFAGLKILGDGELTVKLNVKAHKFSASAKAKIEAAGGTTEVLASRR
ncbi:50S ribosomal protein L15 [Armatimonadota bacterium]|nr:50S ribosomal protein L15 [Armatimonadota bacterium]